VSRPTRPVDELLAERPDLVPSPAYPGLAIRAGYMESA
jgi:hypothetical protein